MQELINYMDVIKQRLSNGDTAEEIIGDLGWDMSCAFLFLNEKDKRSGAHYILRSLSDMRIVSTSDMKALYGEVLRYFLDNDPHLCPHYISSEHHDITIPFNSWEEEVEAITGSSNLEERLVEGWYYDRCRNCRKDCDDRIILENGRTFWCTRDFYNHFNLTRGTPLSRQQKAQETKEESDTYAIGPIVRGLCKKLLEENMAKKADDGVNYMFLGSDSQYAYIALRVAEEAHLEQIPWKSFYRFLSLDASSKILDKGKLLALKKTASEIKKGKRNKPKGNAKIDDMLEEVRRNQG